MQKQLNMIVKELHLPEWEEPILINEDGTYIFARGRLRKATFIKNINDRKGSYRIRINYKVYQVARLVAMAFLGIDNKGQVVLHKDSNTINNHYTNLKWGTRKRVLKISQKNGLHVSKGASTWPLDRRTGNSIHQSKLTADEAIDIAKRLDAGEYAKDIAKEYDVNEMTIRRVRKRYAQNKQVSPRYSNEFKTKVLKEVARGKKTKTQIAKDFGIRYETVWKWNRKYLTLKY